MSIFKTEAAQDAILKFYNEKLASLQLSYEAHDVPTSFGNTHVIVAGDPKLPPVILLHGVNAGSPVALEVAQTLLSSYCLYAIDSIGQATKSAGTRPPLETDDLGRWLVEVMDKMGLETAAGIGVSYGAFLLQKLMAYAPQRLEKAILVVPSALVKGQFWPSMKQLSFPLMRFLLTKKDKDLKRFVQAFYGAITPDALALQRNMLLGTKMDYRTPPLVKAEVAAQYQAPVYVLAVDDDIFFPGPAAIARVKEIYPNVKGTYLLENSKHVPDPKDYPTIQTKLAEWLAEEA